MTRKSIDIRLTNHPVQQKRGHCPLPSGEDEFGQIPKMGHGTGPLQVFRAEACALGELFGINICKFQGSFAPFSARFFIDHLTLPLISLTVLYAQCSIYLGFYTPLSILKLLFFSYIVQIKQSLLRKLISNTISIKFLF